MSFLLSWKKQRQIRSQQFRNLKPRIKLKLANSMNLNRVLVIRIQSYSLRGSQLLTCQREKTRMMTSVASGIKLSRLSLLLSQTRICIQRQTRITDNSKVFPCFLRYLRLDLKKYFLTSLIQAKTYKAMMREPSEVKEAKGSRCTLQWRLIQGQTMITIVILSISRNSSLSRRFNQLSTWLTNLKRIRSCLMTTSFLPRM